MERGERGRTEHFIPVAVPGGQVGELIGVRITGVTPKGLVGEKLREAA